MFLHCVVIVGSAAHIRSTYDSAAHGRTAAKSSTNDYDCLYNHTHTNLFGHASQFAGGDHGQHTIHLKNGTITNDKSALKNNNTGVTAAAAPAAEPAWSHSASDSASASHVSSNASAVAARAAAIQDRVRSSYQSSLYDSASASPASPAAPAVGPVSADVSVRLPNDHLQGALLQVVSQLDLIHKTLASMETRLHLYEEKVGKLEQAQMGNAQ